MHRKLWACVLALAFSQSALAVGLPAAGEGVPSTGCRLNMIHSMTAEGRSKDNTCPMGGGHVSLWRTAVDFAVGEVDNNLTDNYFQHKSWCGSMSGHRGSDATFNDKFVAVYVAPGSVLSIWEHTNFTGRVQKIVGVDGTGTTVLDLNAYGGFSGLTSSLKCQLHVVVGDDDGYNFAAGNWGF